jgi:hypothetical protein
VNSISQKSKLSAAMRLSLFIIALSLTGCAYTSRGIVVEPLNSQNVLNLSADNVVDIMRAAGFTDEQIIEHGMAVRDALAQTGAARIFVNRRVEAIFAVKDQDIYISTELRGLFIYNINTGWVTGNRMAR